MTELRINVCCSTIVFFTDCKNTNDLLPLKTIFLMFYFLKEKPGLIFPKPGLEAEHEITQNPFLGTRGAMKSSRPARLLAAPLEN